MEETSSVGSVDIPTPAVSGLFFLKVPAWVDEDGLTVEISGKGILLTEKSEIEDVMFLNDKK